MFNCLSTNLFDWDNLRVLDGLLKTLKWIPLQMPGLTGCRFCHRHVLVSLALSTFCSRPDLGTLSVGHRLRYRVPGAWIRSDLHSNISMRGWTHRSHIFIFVTLKHFTVWWTADCSSSHWLDNDSHLALSDKSSSYKLRVHWCVTRLPPDPRHWHKILWSGSNKLPSSALFVPGASVTNNK